jgi:hypothetical protein
MKNLLSFQVLISVVLALSALTLTVGCGGTTQNPGTDDDAVAADVAGDVVMADNGADVAVTDVTPGEVDVVEGDAPQDDINDAGLSDVDAAACADALPLRCGDSFNHSTLIQGRPNVWSGYSRTARLENGPETIYELTTEASCKATVRLTNLTVDLDLLRLEECDPWSSTVAASTPLDIQDDEDIVFNTRKDVGDLVVVDGYDGAAGEYTISVDCDCLAPSATYMAAIAECAYQFGDTTGYIPPVPDEMSCMDAPCTADADCPVMETVFLGGQCVTGNCVYCWQDSQCPELSVCRGGRCVNRGVSPCPPPPACDTVGCRLVDISEAVCSVCVCDTVFDDPCSVDIDCQPMAHHFFQHCVYGRCAECRNDSECDGGQCLPPGLCYSMAEHPSVLYGAWLIGWFGGLDHFSYFRFEPDGTLRRGSYASDGMWMDDIMLGQCSVAPDDMSGQIIGTWEPEVTESGFLIIRIDFKALCSAPDWLERFSVTLNAEGPGITLTSVDRPDSMDLTGMRVAADWCSADFAICPLPEYPVLL